MNEDEKAKKCPRCGQWNRSSDLYCRTCWLKFEHSGYQSMENNDDKAGLLPFTSEQIDDLAKQMTGKLSVDSKDRLLNSLPPKYKDRLVEFALKDLVSYFSRNPTAFVEFARDVVREYEKTEMRKGSEIPEWLKQWRQLEREIRIP